MNWIQVSDRRKPKEQIMNTAKEPRFYTLRQALEALEALKAKN